MTAGVETTSSTSTPAAVTTASVEISTAQEDSYVNWFGSLREKTRKSLSFRRRSVKPAKKALWDTNNCPNDSGFLIGCCGVPTCCVVGMFCMLFIPGVTINNYQRAWHEALPQSLARTAGSAPTQRL